MRMRVKSYLGFWMVCVLLAGCSGEERGVYEELGQYAQQYGIFGTYSSTTYQGLAVSYVYDDTRDDLLMLLQGGAAKELYRVTNTSQLLPALTTLGRDPQSLKPLLATTPKDQETLLQRFRPQFEKDLLKTLGHNQIHDAAVLGATLRSEMVEGAQKISCSTTTDFTEQLLCSLYRYLESVIAEEETPEGATSGQTEGETGGGEDSATGGDGSSPQTAKITGNIWFDKDLDGAQDVDEPNLEGVTVILSEGIVGGEERRRQTKTAADGTYSFEGLEVGKTYTVWERLDVGWTNHHVIRGEEVHDTKASIATPRIINGAPSDIDNHPYMAALVINESTSEDPAYDFNGLPVCGASLITPQIAMTAAHCVADFLVPNDISDSEGENLLTEEATEEEGLADAHHEQGMSMLGDEELVMEGSFVPQMSLGLRVDSNYSEAGGHILEVARAIMHPDYSGGVKFWLTHDIALLILKEPVHDMPRVFLPKPFNDEGLAEPGQDVFAIGWGATENVTGLIPAISEGPLPLMKASLLVGEYEICHENYFTHYLELGVQLLEFPARVLCAGYTDQDSCFGDSGGPLYAVKQVAEHDTRHVQLGVVSFGPEACNDPDLLGFYSSVLQHMDFLRQHIPPELSIVEEIVTVAGDNIVSFANFH